MKDFPPRVTAYTPEAEHTPDTSSPTRFLIWMMRQQWRPLAVSCLLSVVWLLPQFMGPWLLGKAIDEGIVAGSTTDLLRWVGLMLTLMLVGAVGGILSHTYVVKTWLIMSYGTTKLITRKSTELGHVLPRRTPTGEVLSISGSDGEQFGHLTEVIASLFGAIVGFIVVAVLILSTSPLLGLIVLVVSPLLLAGALPLLRPMHARQAVERSRNSQLTSMATDIVAGLRILRGIGGERTFGDNYAEQSQRTRRASVSAGLFQSWLDALSVAFSGLFLVLLTWLGVHEVVEQRLSVGQLVSFFGFALFMIVPLQTLFRAFQHWVRSLVSAQKAVAVLGQRTPWQDPDDPQPLAGDADLVDDATGAEIPAGRLTVVVSAVPDDSAALADRLGRYLPRRTTPPVPEDDSVLKGRAAKQARLRRVERIAAAEAEDRELVGGDWGVRLGGVDLAHARLTDVRDTVLVSDAAAGVFAGTLQEAIDPHGQLTREQAETALRVAAAEDVYEAVDGGWQGRIDERGRGLSGGQRQRLVLARALAVDPPILVLVEPTSAVDAHTEARIAERLAAHRRGRTTVATSVSPLLLHHADNVILLDAGKAVASGDHADLLATDPRYAAVVSRALDEQLVDPVAPDLADGEVVPAADDVPLQGRALADVVQRGDELRGVES
ncbi:ABC transporter ATP-binding protein [Propionibacteriaceae bacterium Y2011]|uniref:ABC transporter ATP-binding protein n=1 Tax=Microlunatus sp. Y2014 TaxID=3418488 RepID=UPI003B44664E